MMEEKFLDILGDLWGTDIAYQEDQETIKLILKAIQKAYEMGGEPKRVNLFVGSSEYIAKLCPVCGSELSVPEIASDKCLECDWVATEKHPSPLTEDEYFEEEEL